jgi:hypothetical protein
MSNNVSQWLNSKVNDRDMEKYKVCDNTISPYVSKHDFECYYTENDSDVRSSVQVDDSQLDPYVDHILLYPNTNRYHTNSLFRQLIDHSYSNSFDFKLYNDETNEYDKLNLMDVSLKNSFYRFCHENSI